MEREKDSGMILRFGHSVWASGWWPSLRQGTLEEEHLFQGGSIKLKFRCVEFEALVGHLNGAT